MQDRAVMEKDQPLAEDWARLDLWLTDSGKNWLWLGSQCGWDSGQMSNWKTRGIPTKHYREICDVIGETTDWLYGRQDPAPEAEKMTAMARKIATQFDAIPDGDRRVDTFAKVIADITRAIDGF